MGSGKEMLGNAIGAEGLKKEGIAQNQEGKGYVSFFFPCEYGFAGGMGGRSLSTEGY